MKQIDTIRAALEQAGEYIRSDLASERGAFEGHEGVSRIDEIKADLANNAAALAALAELEKAAADPVAWVIGKPTHGHEIGRYLAWNAGHVPHSVGSAAEPLYAAPPAPVAEIREAVVTDKMCWRVFDNVSDECTTAEIARNWLVAWRAELGTALGLVEIREPTPEECERIYTHWSESVDTLNVPEPVKRVGRAMFDACRAVLWPKEGL